MALLLGQADESGAFVEDGHATVTAWAQATCNWSPAEAKARTRLARLDGRMPSVVPALRCGRIGVAQAMELARLWANPRARHHLPASEEVLVTQAGRLWYLDFQTVCRRWEALADENGAHRDHQRPASTVASTPPSWEPVSTSTPRAMSSSGRRWLRSCTVSSRPSSTPTGTRPASSSGLPSCAGLLERNASQRRFDALHAIFLTAADAPCAPRKGEPLVNLVVDADSFEHHLGPLLRPTHGPARSDHGARPALPNQQRPSGRRPSGGGGRPGGPGAPGDRRFHRPGHRSRPAASAVHRRARAAVQLTDGRCTWPGCSMPAHRCQIDHSIEYARDGPTRVDNGATLCLRHNLHKTRGYTTHRDQHGQWHIHRPRRHRDRPPPTRRLTTVPRGYVISYRPYGWAASSGTGWNGSRTHGCSPRAARTWRTWCCPARRGSPMSARRTPTLASPAST